MLSPSQGLGLVFTVLLLLTLGAVMSAAQDLQISPELTWVLSGSVRDAVTGWPLYASLDIDGYPGEAVWTEPHTGFYSVTLAAGQSYTVHVSAWAPGYLVADRDLGPLGGDRIEDFELEIDLLACQAPGYQRPGLYEPFENDGRAPPGWEVVDNLGNGQVWRFDNPNPDPEPPENKTGGSGDFAVADSDFYGPDGQQDTELRTPVVDLSQLERVELTFATDYWTLDGVSLDVADVDVSVDGGANWSNVWQKTGASYRGPGQEEIDLSEIAAGEEEVMVRFHY